MALSPTQLDNEFARKSVTLKRREAALAEHLKATGLLPDNSRVRVDGFGRSVSQKAVWANKKYIAKFEYQTFSNIDGAYAFNNSQIESLTEITSVIPKKHLQAIESVINKIDVESGRGYCSYNAKTKILTLDPEYAERSIIHEYGHALAEAYKIYDDKNFIDILTDKLDLSNGYVLSYFEADVGRKKQDIYYIDNPKFVDPYQGRCYIDMDTFDYSKPLSPKVMQEYFSVGFDKYFNDPNLLKNKDLQLYNYIERLMNNV